MNEDCMSRDLCACLVVQCCFAAPGTAAPQALRTMGILQARILEWVAMPSSRDLPNPGTKPRSPTLQAVFLPAELPGKP